MMPSIVDWPGAVAVVEEVLGVGVVDGDDRELQHAVLGHGAQADDAGGGLLRAAEDAASGQLLALGESECDQVDTRSAPSSMVMCGLMVEGRADVLVVGLVVLALDGEDGDAVVAAPAQAATSSWVESGLEAHRHDARRRRPCSVRTRLAVSAGDVQAGRHALTPLSGFSLANRSRIGCRTGIAWSAHSMRRLALGRRGRGL